MVSRSNLANFTRKANWTSADTHLSPRYFTEVARYHLANPNVNEETIYVPPMVFDRNLQDVPLPVRTADLMWAGAGLSSLYTGSKICIPTSVYSVPMTLVEHVGGWDTGPEAIGEDMHMYLKCFFALSGNLKSHVVYAAASQCNVSSTLSGFGGYIDGLNARYKQALRHMWGAMDTGFAIRQTAGMIARHWEVNKPVFKKPFKVEDLALATRDMFLTGMSEVCTFNWTASHASSGVHKSNLPKPADGNSASLTPIHMTNVCVLFHRLFEAHFLPIHLALILTVTTIYENIWGSLMPKELALALKICGFFRFIGWSLVVIFFYRYEAYHRLCVEIRRDEMQKASLHEGAAANDGFCTRVFLWFGLFEAGIFPLGGFIFGAIPAAQAVLCQIFTERLTYHVSLKPQFDLQGWKKIKS